MAKLIPLNEEETFGYGDYTHAFVIDAQNGDVTMATANTEQVFTVFAVKDQDQIIKVGAVLTEAFQNTADAAYNTTTCRVGDAGDDDNFITAFQMNKNGTVVTAAYSTGDELPKTYTTATAQNILVTLGAQSGKSLNSLNKGRVVILFKLFRPGPDLKNRGFGGS
jgi:hypothetical protein